MKNVQNIIIYIDHCLCLVCTTIDAIYEMDRKLYTFFTLQLAMHHMKLQGLYQPLLLSLFILFFENDQIFSLHTVNV